MTITAFIEQLGHRLRARRTLLMDELRLHDAIETILLETGTEFHREFPLGRHHRLDFWLPELSTAIEVKRGKAGVQYLPQIGAYLDYDQVQGCILIALRIDPKVPDTFRGKPITKLELWRYLL